MADVLLMLVAGVLAGLIGSTAGLASLVSFPALLLIGLPPVTANVTNTVALVGSGIGSVSGSQRELRGHGRRLAWCSAIGVAGGLLGARLLLITPPGVFERIVPFLVGGASVLLLLQPRVKQVREARALRSEARAVRRFGLFEGGVFLVAVYGGYFGAAAGVMLLALMLLATDEPLPVANAMKNLVLLVSNGVAALGFAFFAPVQWHLAIPLGIGCVVGGLLGPPVVRRAPEAPFRITVAVLGLVLAVRLWVTA